MFRAGDPPDLQLELAVDKVELFDGAVGGIQLEVHTTVRILSTQGQIIDEIHDLGRAYVSPETTVDRAVAAACKSAAEEFDDRYARSSEVSAWLVHNKIASVEVVTLPRRGNQLIWLAASGSFVQGGGDSEKLAFAPSGRLGVTFHWVMFQASYTHYNSPFAGEGAHPNAALSTNDFGLDLGAVLRLGEAVELHAGPGLHLLSGDATSYDTGLAFSSSFSKAVPSVFGSLTVAFLPFRSGLRLIAGVEARGYFNTAVMLDQFGRIVPVANGSFGFFFGGELPWGAKGNVQ